MGTPLLTVAAIRALESAAQDSLPAGELMQRAGRAVAQYVMDLAERRLGRREGLSVCLVCGPGNNGGDGYAAARALIDAGHRALCVRVDHERPSGADGAQAFDAWTSAGGQLASSLPESVRFDVVVDALFGIGLRRALTGEALAAAAWMNRQSLVVSIDAPSGLDADRGVWVGGVAGVQAHSTITLIADKPGLHTADAVDAAGVVVVDSLDVAITASNGSLIEPADFQGVLEPRRRNSHKGQFGTLAVIGGAASMVGAALLAARAALRFGAGRVLVELIGARDIQIDPMQPELMLRAAGTTDELAAIVIGCGLGVDERASAALSRVIDGATPLVIDADALTLLASDAALADRLRLRRGTTILTPHPLEAARLLGTSSAVAQSDRVAAALQLARQTSAIVVLKGAGTVIADSDGRYALNPTGSPALATAGSGDVLAGMLGALLAQRHADWTAALAAVWLHGRAGEGLGNIGLVAGEIPARAVEVLRSLSAGVTQTGR